MKLFFIVVFTTFVVGACSGNFVAGSDVGTSSGSDWGGPLIPDRPVCPGQESAINGTVYAPNGVDPVPGATVFVPSQVPEIFPPTVRCEVCGTLGGTTNFWTTTTSFDGTFSLTGVCPGTRPLVIQNGRFRRYVQVDVPASNTVTLTAQQTRLPRRSAEFDPIDSIPKIAVATGDYDKMECVLEKFGLEKDAYDRYEGAYIRKSSVPLPPFSQVITDINKMKTYNIIFINCTENTFEEFLLRQEVRMNIHEYVNSGGRLYITDWSYDWIEQVEPLSPFIDFEPGQSNNSPEGMNAAALGKDGLHVQAVVKDEQMANWLGLFPQTINGTIVPIEHFLIGWIIMFNVNDDVKIWVEGNIQSQWGDITGVRPLTVTFNFNDCGKILFTSYHTEGRESETTGQAFPAYCGSSVSPQDRILEYLIFDIASCVEPVL